MWNTGGWDDCTVGKQHDASANTGGWLGCTSNQYNTVNSMWRLVSKHFNITQAGSWNTATGCLCTLYKHNVGDSNTATGDSALFSNKAGGQYCDWS